MRALSALLCVGPASLFTTSVDRQMANTTWSFQVINYCAMVCKMIESKYGDPQENEEKFWDVFGNLRAHYIMMLDRMGFAADNPKPIDWVHVLKVFFEENTYEKLSALLLEDVILHADPLYCKSPLVSLTPETVKVVSTIQASDTVPGPSVTS